MIDQAHHPKGCEGNVAVVGGVVARIVQENVGQVVGNLGTATESIVG